MGLSSIPPVMPVYSRLDVAFERGEGVHIYDDKGRRYLDFCSGFAANSLGHCHPDLVKVVQQQAAILWNTSNLYRVPGQEKLARRLIERTFADTVFFCNSGAEAWEGAAKLVRKHFSAKGQPERYRMITIMGGFHGRTLGAISSIGSEKLTKGFGPMLEGFDPVPFNDLDAVRLAITPETAGICIEPILGEGGIKANTLCYLRDLRNLCDEHGLLLLFDEVQCGYGRTGKLFAHEWAGVAPDVMCIAKGMGSGFPVGAFLATADAACGMVAGTHGSTFGGNPLAMAVANAVLDLIGQEDFLAHVTAASKTMWQELEDLINKHPDLITEVRGTGLIVGLRFADEQPVGEVVQCLLDRGLLAISAAENVLRLLPPLIVEDAHIREAVAIVDRVCTELTAK